MTEFKRLNAVRDFGVVTPIQRMRNLGRQLGLRNLFVKRDDLTQFFGNKTRHAKFIFADLALNGVKSVEIIGYKDSNCTRIYSQAARYMNIKVRRTFLDNAYHDGGNYRIISLIENNGSGPYQLHFESHKDIAALGYVDAVKEIKDELPGLKYLYLYSYDATWIGLALGREMHGLDFTIRAIRPLKGPNGKLGGGPDIDYMESIINSASSKCGLGKVDETTVQKLVVDGAVFNEVVHDVLNLEGLLLDPVYTGRAMHRLIQDAENGWILPNDTVLFLHTGGIFSG